MTCDISGAGCKICPGVWLAAILLLVMVVQGWLTKPTTSDQGPATNSANSITKLDSSPSATEESDSKSSVD
ncbi:MAG: hypothetical protein IT423_10375 [Pirellulaceae bacterium]|nr:hypothetical protein [Pirellulaceae bacterium]